MGQEIDDAMADRITPMFSVNRDVEPIDAAATGRANNDQILSAERQPAGKLRCIVRLSRTRESVARGCPSLSSATDGPGRGVKLKGDVIVGGLRLSQLQLLACPGSKGKAVTIAASEGTFHICRG
jgi:hypothetical protein